MDKPAEESHKDQPKSGADKSLKIIAIAAGIVLLGAGVLGGVWMFAHAARTHMAVGVGKPDVVFHERGHMGAGGPGIIKYMDGDKTFTNPTDGTERTVLTGVVTQVSASGFTIAGNGTSKVITTNANTSVMGKDKVAANDSVVVSGKTSGSTFTAESVQIANR